MENQINILYVDDDLSALYALKLGLEDKGYLVRIAETGADALEMMKKEEPDLILADLRMAPMNGFELFQEVRKKKHLQSVRFFFLTAVDDIIAQKYGHSLGVDAYITKPLDLDALDKVIREKVRNK